MLGSDSHTPSGISRLIKGTRVPHCTTDFLAFGWPLESTWVPLLTPSTSPWDCSLPRTSHSWRLQWWAAAVGLVCSNERRYEPPYPPPIALQPDPPRSWSKPMSSSPSSQLPHKANIQPCLSQGRHRDPVLLHSNTAQCWETSCLKKNTSMLYFRRSFPFPGGNNVPR
jgi:hypothetical protein